MTNFTFNNSRIDIQAQSDIVNTLTDPGYGYMYIENSILAGSISANLSYGIMNTVCTDAVLIIKNFTN